MMTSTGRGPVGLADEAQHALVQWVVEVIDAAAAIAATSTAEKDCDSAATASRMPALGKADPMSILDRGGATAASTTTLACASVSMMTASSVSAAGNDGVHIAAASGTMRVAAETATASFTAVGGPVISAPVLQPLADARASTTPALVPAVRGNPVLQPFVAQLCLGVLVRKVHAHGSAIATAFGWGAQERLLRLETRSGVGGEMLTHGIPLALAAVGRVITCLHANPSRADVVAWRKPNEVADSSEGAADASCIPVSSIQAVVAGHATALLQRVGRRDRSHLYVSLVCATRTLDLECASEAERDWMVQGACGAD